MWGICGSPGILNFTAFICNRKLCAREFFSGRCVALRDLYGVWNGFSRLIIHDNGFAGNDPVTYGKGYGLCDIIAVRGCDFSQLVNTVF